MVSPRLLISLCVFVTGAFTGAFLTSLLRLTPSDRCYRVGLRILWQLGGGLWFGYELGRELTGCTHYSDKAFWKSAAGCGTLGIVLCVNPLLDVIGGPSVIEGSVVGERYRRGVRSVQLHVAIESSDGTLHEVSPWGRQANIYEKMVGSCGGRKAVSRFVILRHLGIFLHVECQKDVEEKAISIGRADAPPDNGMHPAGDTNDVINSRRCRAGFRWKARRYLLAERGSRYFIPA